MQTYLLVKVGRRYYSLLEEVLFLLYLLHIYGIDMNNFCPREKKKSPLWNKSHLFLMRFILLDAQSSQSSGSLVSFKGPYHYIAVLVSSKGVLKNKLRIVRLC